MEINRKIFESEVKSFDDENLIVNHFISTERLDRGNDILYADGMKIFGKPVVLFMHGYGPSGMEPVAKPLKIFKDTFKGKKGIAAKTQFFPDDLGKRLYTKSKDGYLANWSVGWRPLKEEFRTDKGGQQIRHVFEWELLEYSLVAVPMQPDAQTMGDKSEQIYVKMLPENEEKFGELIAWKNYDGVWEEKPYPNEHACRLEDPGKYIRIRRENNKFGSGIDAIWGIQAKGPVELQAIRFAKDKFTAAEARKWLSDHNYKCKMFEPATGKCEACDGDTVWKWTDFEKDEGEYICEACREVKGALPYHKTPLAPEGEAWDAGKEVSAADVSDLKAMCAWVDSKNPDLKTSYKLPHHKQAGDHACVWNGVRAAAAALMGARGGVQLAGDKAAVQGHIGKHYSDFGKGDPPWKKDYEEVLTEMFDEWKDGFTKDEQEFIDGFIKSLTERMESIEAKVEGLGVTLSAISEAKKKVDDKENEKTPEPKKVVVVNREEQQREVSKQITIVLTDTISRVVKETVKEEFDRLRGRVK